MTQSTDVLTHFDAQGQAHMVDVGAKSSTRRIAVATGRIEMLPATLARTVSLPGVPLGKVMRVPEARSRELVVTVLSVTVPAPEYSAATTRCP